MAGGLAGLGKTGRGPLLLMFRSGGPAGRTSRRAGRTSRKPVLLMLGPASHQSDQRAGCRAGGLAGLGKTGRGPLLLTFRSGGQRTGQKDERRAARTTASGPVSEPVASAHDKQAGWPEGWLALGRSAGWLASWLAGWLAAWRAR